jgi:hypothetical protein
MAIQLVTKFAPLAQEKFFQESKLHYMINNDYEITGAQTVKIYKITTSAMNDYDRTGANAETQWSRYGAIASLDATVQTETLSRDRSFTFVLDKADIIQTDNVVGAASALARQMREVVTPEIDTYGFAQMVAGAGNKPAAVALTEANIYEEIVKATETLDDALVPEDGRFLLVTPATYALMKKSADITMETNVGQDMRINGVIANLDGMNVIKVAASRLPSKFGFLAGHPSATIAPMQLNDYKIHDNPPGISGNLVEGRVIYDTFVLDNKADGLYYQALA